MQFQIDPILKIKKEKKKKIYIYAQHAEFEDPICLIFLLGFLSALSTFL